MFKNTKEFANSMVRGALHNDFLFNEPVICYQGNGYYFWAICKCRENGSLVVYDKTIKKYFRVKSFECWFVDEKIIGELKKIWFNVSNGFSTVHESQMEIIFYTLELDYRGEILE